jgi:hypothetical protein
MQAHLGNWSTAGECSLLFVLTFLMRIEKCWFLDVLCVSVSLELKGAAMAYIELFVSFTSRCTVH